MIGPGRWRVVVAVMFLMLAACDRDPRVSSGQDPAAVPPPPTVPQIPLVPGMPRGAPAMRNPFTGDTHALAEGKRLYHWMNCSGCHFNGGGGIGPPLMDDDWIYGGDPAQIFDSIASGRANGMPTYGDKLAAEQIWQIVAFVETLNPDRRSGSSGDERNGAGVTRQ